MSRLFVGLLLTVLLLVSAVPAAAERGLSDLGMSQIAFDESLDKKALLEEPVVQEKTNAPSIELQKAILAKKKAAPKKKAPAKQATARAMLDLDIKPDTVFLVPNLKGPQTNPQSPSTITTSKSWPANSKGSCVVTASKTRTVSTRMIKKAQALKELLERFSGNNDFFYGQCSKTCPKTDDISLPSAMTVKDTHGGTFTIKKLENACHYHLEKLAENPWMVLEPERLDCSCLPRTDF